jgi:hypothetical protein
LIETQVPGYKPTQPIYQAQTPITVVVKSKAFQKISFDAPNAKVDQNSCFISRKFAADTPDIPMEIEKEIVLQKSVKPVNEDWYCGRYTFFSFNLS